MEVMQTKLQENGYKRTINNLLSVYLKVYFIHIEDLNEIESKFFNSKYSMYS